MSTIDRLECSSVVSDEYLNALAKIEYEQACGRVYPWEGVQQWLLNAMRAAMQSPFAVGAQAHAEYAELERRNAELVGALKEARKAVVKCCNAAVEQLRTVAPEMKWDDGDKTAAIYIAPIDAALAHSAQEKVK